MAELKTFNYEREKIIEEAEKKSTIPEQIDYLLRVKEEYIKNKPRLDVNLGREPGLEEYIDKIVETKRKRINVQNPKPLKTKYETKDLIWWKGTETMLIYLLDNLISIGLIDISLYEEKYAIIEKHFKNKLGNNFKNINMSSSTQNMKLNKNEGKPRKTDAEKIENILRDLRNYIKKNE